MPAVWTFIISMKTGEKLVSASRARKGVGLLFTMGVPLLLAAPFIQSGNFKGGVLTGTIELTESASATNKEITVYLKEVQGDYEASERVAVMDQEDQVFVPHLLVVQKGQTVKFENSDPFTHNVHLYSGRRSLFNVSQGIKGQSDWAAPRAGEYLVRCNIHRKMSAFILVVDHPFFTTIEHQSSTAAPQFKFEDIPEGAYTLVVARYVEAKGKLERQEQEVTIAPGKITTVNLRF
jgi:plastocyanin